MSEEYSVGYNEGYQTGRNEAIDELEQENRLLRARNERLEREGEMRRLALLNTLKESTVQKPDAMGCHLPPHGWRCTRTANHDGPCAAVESPEDIELVARAMKRLREATPPAAKQQWVGLSDEQKLSLEIQGGKSDVMLAELVEGWLKEKNL